MKKRDELLSGILVFIVGMISIYLPLVSMFNLELLLASLFAVILSVILTSYFYKCGLQFKHVLSSSLMGWFLGVFVGITYLMLINPSEVEGVYLGLCCTGPIGGVIGLSIEALPRVV